MADKDDTVADKPDEEPKAEEKTEADENVADEPEAEESKEEKPDDSTAAPADAGAESTGTDQQGRQLYSVKCSKCGKDAQVPFKPSGDRPVYCRDCYAQQRDRQ